MIGAHHVDLYTVVCEVLGLNKSIASEAAWPDSNKSISVGSVGCHMFGLDFASLRHFAVPQFRAGKLVGYRGYSWDMDVSTPPLDLPNREVYANSVVWDREAVAPLDLRDPLAALLADLRTVDEGKTKQRGSTFADEMTFSPATAHVEWLGKWYLRIADRVGMLGHAALLRLAWLAHFIADTADPWHAHGWLLKGHAAAEAKQYEDWQKMRHAGKLPFGATIESLRKIKPREPRLVAEANALWAYKLNDRKATEEISGQALTSMVAVTKWLLQEA